MFWKYRAINNPVAKKKYFLYSLLVISVFVIGAIYRILNGAKFSKVIILLAFCMMLVFLYTLIILGKERVYFMDDSEVVYKPFKTKISDIKDFKVDEKNLLIKLTLNKPKLFSVRTLYFDEEDELWEAKMFLEKYIKHT